MGRILLAEDEFLIRFVLAEELIAGGHEVVEAASGDEAITRFGAGEAFDMLITDVQMPGTMDGLALAASLKRSSPRLLVVYTTGRPDILNRLGALGPMEAYVLKPFTALEVVTVANGLLAAGRCR